VADARACIRHLQKIHKDYIAYGCEAVEVIAAAGLENEPAVRDLSQNFRWCKTYYRYVGPFDRNVFCSIPHWDEGATTELNRLRTATEVVKEQHPLQPSADIISPPIQGIIIPNKRRPGRPRRVEQVPEPVS
jgi:hypothetical protein